MEDVEKVCFVREHEIHQQYKHNCVHILCKSEEYRFPESYIIWPCMTCTEFLSMLALDPGHPDIIYPPHFDNALGREVMQIAHADARAQGLHQRN